MTTCSFTPEEYAAEAKERALRQAAPLFTSQVIHMERLIKMGARSAAMLRWASMCTVFRGFPDYDSVLDAALPRIKALPVEPAPPAASPGPQGG